MKLYFFYIISNISAYNLPPINSIYNKNINIPFVGSQLIETKMISNNKAKIKLSGIVNTNGLAFYYLKNNEINIKLSKDLEKLLSDLSCEFSEPNYNKKKDQVSFNIYIKKIYFNKKIILNKNNFK